MNISIVTLYLIGWFIYSLCNYIYNVYIYKTLNSKKLQLWRSFWSGIFSWVAIIVAIVTCIIYLVTEIDSWVESKLE